MIRFLNSGTERKSEILLRSSASEPLTQAKLAKSIYIGGTQIVKTFTAANICDYLYTMDGKPTYNPSYVNNSIGFTTGLDICYMKPNVCCRSISGSVNAINQNYDSKTMDWKYIFCCNFTGNKYCSIVARKLSYGYYQTKMDLWLNAGDNSVSYDSLSVPVSAKFSISYNGSAYEVKFGSYSVTSEPCHEQTNRLELAGSADSFSAAQYALKDLSAVVTTGMARY